MTQTKKNIIANFVGNASTMIPFLFVPKYIAILGLESWGIVGIFTSLMAGFALLDAGLSSTVNREMARLSAEEVPNVATMRTTIKTIEFVYVLAALCITLLVFFGSNFIATKWIHSTTIAPERVIQIIRLMSISIGAFFLFPLYNGALMGLQRQIAVNVIITASSLLRGFGVVLVLMFVSPTLEAYFATFAVVGIVQALVGKLFVWQRLEFSKSVEKPRIELALFRQTWRYTSGAGLLGIVTMLFNQMDKVVLSATIPLADFGAYSLVTSITALLFRIVAPISGSVFPKMTQAAAQGNIDELMYIFRRASQLSNALIISAVGFLAFFSKEIIVLWTNNPILAEKTSVLLTLLSISTGLHAIVAMSQFLEFAQGKTFLPTVTYVIAVLLLIVTLVGVNGRIFAEVLPTLQVAISHCAIGLVVFISIGVGVLRGKLQNYLMQWITKDVLYPMFVAGSVAFILHEIMMFSPSSTRLSGIIHIFSYGILILVVTTFSLYDARMYIQSRIKSHS